MVVLCIRSFLTTSSIFCLYTEPCIVLCHSSQIPPVCHTSSLAADAAKLLQSCLTLCDPIDGSPPGSPVPGILQCVKVKSKSEVTQLCPTLSDPMDCSLPCSLEGLMLKLKLQYFGHLMRRADSLGKTLMLGKIGGRRRKGQQRIR